MNHNEIQKLNLYLLTVNMCESLRTRTDYFIESRIRANNVLLIVPSILIPSNYAKMSLKKKDPNASGGLRVTANDPHLVSLGGGRLSTVVTIHYIPIGSTTIGSSPSCSVSLNGSGVRNLHCSVKRNEEGEITILPEVDARVLIDGNKITSETKLTQGAMLTIGNSNYLRFNNPAEAQLIRSTMGSNERISMPQIDFTQDANGGSNRTTPEEVLKNFNSFLESQNKSSHKQNNETVSNKSAKIEYLNITNFFSPKVFTADSITVNAPAKDVLGPKYANFAKNLAENHMKEKNLSTKTNNEMNLKTSNNYVNIPSSFIQNSSTSSSSSSPSLSSHSSATSTHLNSTSEVLTKVNNNSSTRNYCHLSSTYDRYPKPGSYGGLQIYPMNGVNSDINCPTSADVSHNQPRSQELSPQEQERVDEILKMCAEFERQNQVTTNSVQSSPIVQNRIKTNGSLPREKKSPFYDIGSQSSKAFFPDKQPPTKYMSTGYENVRLVGDRRVEIGGATCSPKISSGYENVTLSSKYTPQSPRTKIRTTCTSPKRDIHTTPQITHPTSHQAKEYAHLIQSFENKLKFEMDAMRREEGSRSKNTASPEPMKKRPNRNINNLTLDLSSATDDDKDKEKLEDLKLKREAVLDKIRRLKTQIADVQRQEDEVIREMDMEKALVSAEMDTVNGNIVEMEKTFVTLQSKIHRMEAQRNANRVMQETQQAKLKQSIEVKQEQVARMEILVAENRSDTTLKEDLEKTKESLENDRKTFEDMEFQYLEEETEWLAYREELHNELKSISKQIEDKRVQMLRLENEGVENQNAACSDTKTLENNLLTLLTTLEKSREELQSIDKTIFEISGQQQSQSDSDDDGLMNYNDRHSHPATNMMSQSLFGSTEILSAKPKDVDLMSRSVNENMFFNNIEMPSFSRGASSTSTSTPKKELKIFQIHDDTNTAADDTIPKMVHRRSNEENDPLLKLKYNVDSNSSPSPTPSSADELKAKVNLNLSLGSDDFEVNPLEKRMPSQDDIDRISKVTLDAPISTTKGASTKIIESIKEIERNRQLLLAQQGSHVIEHERQKMLELKKKSKDEARIQYLQQISGSR
ncbi:unnamed protein product [Hermetia illucens]|uniref:FHA domain-containing protein n=2 Tax=Hermetia illucens TaxID=343691 RepID=A0A7R8UUV2_HERIL|nr:unnamed protein product [Hermetia illucens]